MFKFLIKAILVLSIFQLSILKAPAQLFEKMKSFTHADTLRGSIGPGRLLWNVLHYEITVKPHFANKTIEGKNIITYMDSGVFTMQLDLQEPMLIDSIVKNDQHYKFTREGNVYWVQLRDPFSSYGTPIGKTDLTVYFHGKPIEAIRPPWDNGWIWKKDKSNNPWITVSSQGLGASAWYPCKDTQSDEPDNGAILHIFVPDSLTGVGNGRLTGQQALHGANTIYTWEVKSPINNYCIIPSIGKYVHFSEIYNGMKGKLTMDYWVLDYNLDKAKKQFTDATRTMKAFEYWFGPYPFYNDGYKLVESPYLGMEHQSATAYGNLYLNGYLGTDLSGSGWGLKWDFIIVHESSHEWFANNITSNDIADMWVHEGFANYSETLFTDYYYGKEAGNDYVTGTRKKIKNDKPIIGTYGVNQEGSGDMYYKAGNMLHMIRQVMKSDKKFRKILTGLNKTFYHQTVTSAQVENYISKKAGFDFSKIFDQYLRTIQIPVLEYKIENKEVSYRWANSVEHFNLPVLISLGKKEHWIKPTNEWQKIIPGKWYDEKTFSVNRNFYIEVKNVLR